jgi:hypothetical protein
VTSQTSPPTVKFAATVWKFAKSSFIEDPHHCDFSLCEEG